jgi:hypothetical protein
MTNTCECGAPIEPTGGKGGTPGLCPACYEAAHAAFWAAMGVAPVTVNTTSKEA